MKHSVMGIVLFLGAFLLSNTATSNASHAGLIINAAEMGIGKFHRLDNVHHAYSDDNVWKSFVLSNDVTPNTPTPIVIKNKDVQYTIFFSTLEELLRSIVKLSQDLKQPVTVLNLNAHGLPGGTWFPKDAANLKSPECASWLDAAKNSDQDNYDQYYTGVTKDEIMMFRQISQVEGYTGFGCIVGLKEWYEIVAKVPAIKTVFDSQAQVHFLSCLVGAGTRGDSFTKGLALLLFNQANQKVQTSIKFGLGDWSMPEGMGFWDYMDDEQLARDNAAYPVNRNDREEMQKGDIRVASIASPGTVTSGLIKDVDFMYLSLDTRAAVPDLTPKLKSGAALPKSIRIPGTRFTVDRERH